MTWRRRARRFVVYGLARAAIAMIALFPPRWAAALGAALGSIACTLAARPRRIAAAQAGTALSGDGARVARACFRHLGRSVGELCALARIRRRWAAWVELPDQSRSVLDAALARGAGVLYVTGHLGNWELMAAALADRGYPIHTIARAPHDPRLAGFVRRFRARHGVRGIYRGEPGAAKSILRVLRGGRGHPPGVLGFFIDQDTEVEGAFVPFFGQPAYTPVGAAVLARRLGVPVVIGTVRRAGPRHRIEIEAADPLPGEADQSATARWTAALEARIRQAPEQWVWMHERWRTRPGA